MQTATNSTHIVVSNPFLLLNAFHKSSPLSQTKLNAT
uniref:60S ribosomal protein L7a n=1 Tax=Rhizophora mucronata TaxID=61149 RepID=A0A2P2IXN7_RHIMU